MLTRAQRFDQATVDTYLVTIELPEGLKTNYGQILDFQPDMGGTAEIVVSDRRLIERIFNNLKYRIK